MRKSPIKHTVKKHTRKGRVVHSFIRGKGNKKFQRYRRLKKSKPEAFKVTLIYSDKKTETQMIFAPVGNYSKAIEEGLEERERKEMPIAIKIIDPSIGAALKFIGRSVGKGMRWTAGYAKRVAPKIAKVTKRAGTDIIRETATLRAKLGTNQTVITGVQEKDAKRLLVDSYSNDPETRKYARATIKKRHPEIYDQCHFSPPEYKTPLERGRV